MSTRPVRFVKNTRPTTRRRPSPSNGRVRAAPAVEPAPAERPRSTGSRMPGWGELEKGNRREAARRSTRSLLLDSVSTARLSLLILGAALLVTLYVGHVHATQRLAEDVQAMRSENLKLHLRFNRIRGAFDQASGPSVIYERARKLGLTESLPNGYPVIVD